MLKIVLLLAFVVFVSGASVKKDKHLLGELIRNLQEVRKNLTMEEEFFLKDLKTTCHERMFCQAELELKKVSGLTKYDDFRIDGKLMRNLFVYIRHHQAKHHGNACTPVSEDQDKIPLKDFLGNLIHCFQNAYSKI